MVWRPGYASCAPNALGAEHQVRIVNGLIGSAVAEKPGHPDIERVVELEVFLGAQGVDDRESVV